MLCQGASTVNLSDGYLSAHIDRIPLSISPTAPLEYAVEVFGKLGVSDLVVVEDGSAKAMGMIFKRDLLAFLDVHKP